MLLHDWNALGIDKNEDELNAVIAQIPELQAEITELDKELTAIENTIDNFIDVMTQTDSQEQQKYIDQWSDLLASLAELPLESSEIIDEYESQKQQVDAMEEGEAKQKLLSEYTTLEPSIEKLKNAPGDAYNICVENKDDLMSDLSYVIRTLKNEGWDKETLRTIVPACLRIVDALTKNPTILDIPQRIALPVSVNSKLLDLHFQFARHNDLIESRSYKEKLQKHYDNCKEKVDFKEHHEQYEALTQHGLQLGNIAMGAVRVAPHVEEVIRLLYFGSAVYNIMNVPGKAYSDYYHLGSACDEIIPLFKSPALENLTSIVNYLFPTLSSHFINKITGKEREERYQLWNQEKSRTTLTKKLVAVCASILA